MAPKRKQQSAQATAAPSKKSKQSASNGKATVKKSKPARDSVVSTSDDDQDFVVSGSDDDPDFDSDNDNFGRDDVQKSDTSGTTSKSAEKFERFRSTHLPHLSPIPKGVRGLHPVDIYDPASFEEIDNGNVGPDDYVLPRDEFEQNSERTDAVLKSILEAYQSGANAGTVDHVMATGNIAKAKAMDIDAELARITAHMPANTRAALGTPKFAITDTDSMTSFSPESLECNVLYRGWIVKVVNGVVKIASYISITWNQDGSGARVVDIYEKCLRYARRDKLFHTAIVHGFAAHAAAEGVIRIIIRPLLIFAIPDSEEERTVLYKDLHFYEGVMTDFSQALMKGHGPITIKRGEHEHTFLKQDMFEFSSAFSSPRFDDNYSGLNVCHPISQGYRKAGRNKVHIRIIDALEQQAERRGNYLCPLCDHDLHTRIDSNAHNLRSSNLWLKLREWLIDEVICPLCKQWMINNDYRRDELLDQAGDMADFRALRQKSIVQKGEDGNRRSGGDDSSDTHCSTCNVAYVARNANELMGAYKKRTKAAKLGPHESIAEYSWCPKAMCFGCYRHVTERVGKDNTAKTEWLAAVKKCVDLAGFKKILADKSYMKWVNKKKTTNI